MNEDDVVRVMLSAQTEEAVASAKRLSLYFIQENPGALKVILAGGGLHMKYTANTLRCNE